MKKFFTLLTLLFLVGSISLGYLYRSLNLAYRGPDKVFVVKNGETFPKINSRLFKEGFIQDKRLFHYYAKFKNVLTKFKAGEFTIPSGSRLIDIMDILVYGQPNLRSLTIPEGKNMYEIAKMLDEKGITSREDFIKLANDQTFVSSLKIEANSIEGYLYPETYRFAPQTPASQVLGTMVELFKSKTKRLNLNHPELSAHEILILASVVEKETGAKHERPTIAGVFLNRLKKKMRLQSDPTTIYGIWSRYRGNLSKQDLLEVTPYNTYKIPALPTGPIANPSLEAIEAVLNPEKHDYLYFVSRNDGTHVFSQTYVQHQKAVENFQMNAKARQGKSWRDLRQ